MRYALLFVPGALLLLLARCAPSTADRCGDDFAWDGESHTCWPIAEDAGEAPEIDASVEEDGGGGGGALPAGLGVACSELGDAPECAGKEASYCAFDPGAGTGYCTITDCQTAPNDCPGTYQCCNFTMISELICVTSEQFDQMGAMCDN